MHGVNSYGQSYSNRHWAFARGHKRTVSKPLTVAAGPSAQVMPATKPCRKSVLREIAEAKKQPFAPARRKVISRHTWE